jgi:hypothetical protein
MPNWVSNTIRLTGSKPAIITFLNKAQNVKKINKSCSDEQFIKKVMDFNKYECSLSSWRKCPKTFENLDTTNDMRKRDSIDYDTHKPLFNSDEEYQQYCKKFNNVVKYQKRKYGIVGWYDYHCHIWGTKWDSEVEIKSIQKKDNVNFELEVFTDTAWAPPVEWLNYLNEQFPDLHITVSYVDEGDPATTYHYDFLTDETTEEVDEELRKWLMS